MGNPLLVAGAKTGYPHQHNELEMGDRFPPMGPDDWVLPSKGWRTTFHSKNGRHYRLCVDDNNVPFFRELSTK